MFFFFSEKLVELNLTLFPITNIPDCVSMINDILNPVVSTEIFHDIFVNL